MNTKQCRAECKRILPLSAFGVNKKYKSGRHNYCSDCCRNKVNAHRAGIKVMRKRSVMSPSEKVIKAIQLGLRTQKEIARRIRMHDAEVDYLIAELILDKKQIVSKTVGETRQYFLAA